MQPEKLVSAQPAAESLPAELLAEAVLSDPDLSGTAATMERVGLAGAALVRVLRGDLRVIEAYTAWRRSLPRDLTRYQRKADDLATLDRLLRQDLGLDYRWLAPLLLFDFGDTVRQELTGATDGGVRLTPEDVGLPAGRRAKGSGDHIVRYVEWFYRAKIKHPPDSIRSLGRAYLETLDGPRRAGDGRAEVEAGIKRAKRLLAVLIDDTPLPK